MGLSEHQMWQHSSTAAHSKPIALWKLCLLTCSMGRGLVSWPCLPSTTIRTVLLARPLCRKPGSFCGLQLLPGEQLDESAGNILSLLAKSLVEKPRLQDELGWLRNFPDKVRAHRDSLQQRISPGVVLWLVAAVRQYVTHCQSLSQASSCSANAPCRHCWCDCSLIPP